MFVFQNKHTKHSLLDAFDSRPFFVSWRKEDGHSCCRGGLEISRSMGIEVTKVSGNGVFLSFLVVMSCWFLQVSCVDWVVWWSASGPISQDAGGTLFLEDWQGKEKESMSCRALFCFCVLILMMVMLFKLFLVSLVFMRFFAKKWTQLHFAWAYL